METNSKIRFVGSFISGIALLYYFFEIEQQIENWYSFTEISNLTQCSEVYGLELWLLSQSIIWCISIAILLIVFLMPSFIKLMLCFMYLVGPLFFLWTFCAIIFEATFLSCCEAEGDKCENFYPFKHSANFIVLLGVSLLFSTSVTILLMSILIGAIWQQLRGATLRYEQLH